MSSKPPTQEPQSAKDTWADANLVETLKFLALPVSANVIANLLQFDLPGIVTYIIAATHLPWMFARLGRNPELAMAATILYIPLARLYVVPVAPGLNGTNILMLSLIYAWWNTSRKSGNPFFRKLPLTGEVKWWGIISFTSFLTSIYTFGFAPFMEDRVGLIKVWSDQFILFFAFVNLIRDPAMARRVVIYLMIGSAVVAIAGFSEWLVKRDARTIEAGRLLGPQGQPNDLAAFLAYGSGPFIAYFLLNFNRASGLASSVYLAIVARVLIASASRGGYIGFGVEVLIAMLTRGKMFLIYWVLAAASIVAIFPQVIPNTLVARMNETSADQQNPTPSPGAGAENLDKSSQTRLILWKAALDMTLESPILGKGYYSFPFLKGQYTEFEVHESDNHNMYLWICSQMGIPALLAVIYVFWRLSRMSSMVHKQAKDPWARTIGLGTASMCAAIGAVNMFGSRLVDVSVMGYIWIYAAVIPHLWAELQANEAPKSKAITRQITR